MPELTNLSTPFCFSSFLLLFAYFLTKNFHAVILAYLHATFFVRPLGFSILYSESFIFPCESQSRVPLRTSAHRLLVHPRETGLRARKPCRSSFYKNMLHCVKARMKKHRWHKWGQRALLCLWHLWRLFLLRMDMVAWTPGQPSPHSAQRSHGRRQCTCEGRVGTLACVGDAGPHQKPWWQERLGLRTAAPEKWN